MKNNYAIFILSYGRPNKVITHDTLRRVGYTGKIYIVCSDDDKTLNKYNDRYPGDVIVFNKESAAKRFDMGDNFKDKRVVVYARNEVFYIAEKLGYEYFIVMDDDYIDFRFIADSNDEYHCKTIKNLDNIFKIYMDYFSSINALSIAPIQGGDLIGGKKNEMFSGGVLKRKVMNVWFLSTKRKFIINGRINEDVTTYLTEGSRGGLFLQVPDFRVYQLQTQSNPGGLTEFYLDTGTYQKSFYSVIMSPSSIKVGRLHSRKDQRLHHVISWNNTCPKILDESHKKAEQTNA